MVPSTTKAMTRGTDLVAAQMSTQFGRRDERSHCQPERQTDHDLAGDDERGRYVTGEWRNRYRGCQHERQKNRDGLLDKCRRERATSTGETITSIPGRTRSSPNLITTEGSITDQLWKASDQVTREPVTTRKIHGKWRRRVDERQNLLALSVRWDRRTE
jgi:hypothetical protein